MAMEKAILVGDFPIKLSPTFRLGIFQRAVFDYHCVTMDNLWDYKIYRMRVIFFAGDSLVIMVIYSNSLLAKKKTCSKGTVNRLQMGNFP